MWLWLSQFAHEVSHALFVNEQAFQNSQPSRVAQGTQNGRTLSEFGTVLETDFMLSAPSL